mmetsp:Transcript_50626/g.94606  ORF Transcript_50626/g.94606 Transcript_50626/m.94606 type:complete len:580 (+) Transcript_50626:91-1830(+)
MAEVQATPSKNSLSEDHIEDYSETEEAASSAPLPIVRTPPGVAGRFASYLGAKGSGQHQRQEDPAAELQHVMAISGDLISTIKTDGSEPRSEDLPRKQRQAIPDSMPTRLQDRLEQAARSEGVPQMSYDVQEQESIAAETPLDTLPASSEALQAAGHHPEAASQGAEPDWLREKEPATASLNAEQLGREDPEQIGTWDGGDIGAVTTTTSAGILPPEASRADGDSEASDLEQHATLLSDELPGVPEAGAGLEDMLEEEPWMSRPTAERDLWERVRPRALRREAAQVQDLRFNTAALSRIMKLHPSLANRTSEALEVVNYATVLLLQAVARAAARSRPTGNTVQFQDIRQTCLNASELQFLLPANGTLDASALTIVGMRSDAPTGGGEGDEEGAADGDRPAAAAASGTTKRGRRTGTGGAGPGHGQSMLNASIFARHAAPETSEPATVPSSERTADMEAGDQAKNMQEDADASKVEELRAEEGMATDEAATDTAVPAELEDAGEFTPEKPGQKRKAPASSKKQASKAPRVASSARKTAAAAAAAAAGGGSAAARRGPGRNTAGAAPATGGGLANFFRRSS